MTHSKNSVIIHPSSEFGGLIEKAKATVELEKHYWERYKEICKSLGSNASTELRRHIIETVRTAEARSDSEQVIIKKGT